MKLFNSKKDILLRILNLVFLIWFIIATITLYNGVVNYVLKEKIEKFSVYRERNCIVEICEDETTICSINKEKTEEDIKCENDYNLYEKDLIYKRKNYLRQILASVLIIITVATTIIITNKKKVN